MFEHIEARIVAMNAIVTERERQEDLKVAGKFQYSCSDNIPSGTAYAILGEEFGEVGRAINEKDDENLYEELVQVAAVALAWAEGLIMRGGVHGKASSGGQGVGTPGEPASDSFAA